MLSAINSNGIMNKAISNNVMTSTAGVRFRPIHCWMRSMTGQVAITTSPAQIKLIKKGRSSHRLTSSILNTASEPKIILGKSYLGNVNDILFFPEEKRGARRRKQTQQKQSGR